MISSELNNLIHHHHHLKPVQVKFHPVELTLGQENAYLRLSCSGSTELASGELSAGWGFCFVFSGRIWQLPIALLVHSDSLLNSLNFYFIYLFVVWGKELWVLEIQLRWSGMVLSTFTS